MLFIYLDSPAPQQINMSTQTFVSDTDSGLMSISVFILDERLRQLNIRDTRYIFIYLFIWTNTFESNKRLTYGLKFPGIC